jgi:5-hydroxyisourate hydrolase
MSAITTHVLDTAHGRPAGAVPVTLERLDGGRDWQLVGRGETDADGRLRTLMPEAGSAPPGIYRLTFDTASYFAALGARAFYPHVSVTFEVVQGEAHYHVPLLLSPFGYTTYRGS